MRPRYTNYLRVPIPSLCVQKATQTIRRPIATNPAHPNQNENLTIRKYHVRRKQGHFLKITNQQLVQNYPANSVGLKLYNISLL